MLLTVTCFVAAMLCAGIALPAPVWALGVMLAVLGFCLGVGQPLSMTTVVQAAPDGARSTALALRLTGNRLGQVAAPAAAGLVAGVAGVAAPFVMLGALLLVSSGVALRSPERTEGAPSGVGADASLRPPRRGGWSRSSPRP
ncbi:MFS transporter [Streptomyces hyaluromycini]|uniref:MFS transporter n=1 Tax=Streptomyces hyaluromycini TaxID=1377993 RepID=UPI003F65D68B